MIVKTARVAALAGVAITLLTGAVCWIAPTTSAAFGLSICGAALTWAAVHRFSQPPVAAVDPAVEQLRAALAAAQDGLAETHAAQTETIARMRHDVRNALAAALLTADRLAMSDDAAKQRAGTIIVAAISRAAELLR